MFKRVLVANRGEIAVRIILACRELAIEVVLAVSAADTNTLGAKLADSTVVIGGPNPSESYLNISRIMMAAISTHCDAIHPGYGFLAESSAFANACAENGISFIGPTAHQIQTMGNKIEARNAAMAFDVPVVPGSNSVATVAGAVDVAGKIGFPLLIKAAAGGGGKGMRVIHSAAELTEKFAATASEAQAAFGDGTLYIERYIERSRHVEVQVLADKYGTFLHIGERDCSLQRRHQKLLEESLAPGLSSNVRTKMRDAAVALIKGIGYENAGTVEFILDIHTQDFYFLEMNTRIQVEHPVTEAISGIDLVQEQIRVASGERLRLTQDRVKFHGHALECRINAEDPGRSFMPSPGVIDRWVPPISPNVRVDSHCFSGYEVPIYYDSLLAKVIAYGADREEARCRMIAALGHFHISGVQTTIPFQLALLQSDTFKEVRMTTSYVDEISASNAIGGLR